MASPAPSRPRRALLALAVILVALLASIGASAAWGQPKGQWAPKLGLDLEGGTSITLIPRSTQQGAVTDESIAQAVQILRQRVNGFGVSEAAVTAQGTGTSQTILITVPGRQGGDILETVQRTAELRFRRVLAAVPAGSLSPQPGLPDAPVAPQSGTATPSDGASAPDGAQPSTATGRSARATPSGAATPAGTATPTGAATPSDGPTPSGSATPRGRVVPEGLRAAAPSPAPPAAGTVSTTVRPASPSATPTEAPAGQDPAGEEPGAEPADPASAVPLELQERFLALDCSKPAELRRTLVDDPAQPLVTCSEDGTEKFLLGPAELQGTDVSGATATLAQNAQGQTVAGNWQVNLDFTGEGTRKFGDLTTQVVGQRVAIVLDALVVSAPTIQQAITGGSAQITGDFAQKEATDLANVLRYGSLPLAFDPGTVQEVSASLGRDQLRAGLIAGALGLVLVVLYSLLYYRGLGVVNVVSLGISTVLTYLAIVLLSNTINLRLSLAGIAGLVIGIGIAADSFIVYFERLRDEMRDGRTLRVAVETAWRRARRTILAADFVSFLAALVLYVLSVDAVKGFAINLGLATVIDVVVVFLFTKPVVTLLARHRFFADGHPLSGLDRRRMGAPEGPAAAPRPRRRPAAAAATRSYPQEA